MAIELLIHVEVVYAGAHRSVQRVALELPAGSTAEQALQRSNLVSNLTTPQRLMLEVGVWGRKVAAGHVLRDRDRVELYRPLTVDPKVARRERFARQGAKTAGLFAKRREGAKSGY
ncbi:MAG: RnfH family protein [Rhodoferax sp.]|nr:RnfH family protein [Rhodoferax sp.]